MATVLITGGSGLVGRSLTKALLERNYEVIILTRPAKKRISTIPGLRYAEWDIEKRTVDEKAISEADYIIHLAGAGIADKRWTKKRKQEIVSSRVESSKLIVDSLKKTPNKVKAVISASAIGWYLLSPNPSPLRVEGRDHRALIETDTPANDFLGTTCQKWEASIETAKHLGKRVVKLRTGIVLSREGGALKEFLKPIRFGIAAILGSGKQMISWIHIDDLVNMYIAAIENENMDGVYNAVAPHPVSNKELTLQLAKSRKHFFIPVYIPAFVLKLFFGEMSIEVLKSSTVSSNRIQQTGFKFHYPLIADALAAIG